MPVRRQHHEPYPEAPRVRDLPATPDSAVTAPDRDARTGRFVPGNTASRRRKLKAVGRQLAWLRDDSLAPWIAPYATAAREHAGDLLADLGMVGPMASPLAEELASARLVYRGLLALGLAGDPHALAEARQWLREARQTAITLEALARAERAAQGPADPHAAVFEAFGAPTTERTP